MTFSARWRAGAAAAWLPWALASGAAVGFLAVRVGPYFAPLVVFPLLLGLSLALSLVVGLRACSLAHAPTAYAGAVLAALLVVVSQHYWSYRATSDWQSVEPAKSKADRPDQNLKMARQAFPDLFDPPPANLVEYLRTEAADGRELYPGYRVRGALVWACWALESVLVIIAAVLPVVWTVRQPYCPRCQSWLRTSRGGSISETTATQLADCVGLHGGSGCVAAYRLLTCRAGCSPSLLELSWGRGGKACRAWLDTHQRRAVAEVLDRDSG